MRILPLSTIDDNRTILQEVLRIRKYLEENPIRNLFYIDEEYDSGIVAYDVTKVEINSTLDVTIAADDILIFSNGYIAIVDNVGAEYVTIQPESAQRFKGDKGDKGDTGVSITSVTKTGTSGLVDTYTITFSNGNTSTFTVTNGAAGADGVSIVSVTKTDTIGLVDYYTITFSNNQVSTFTVTNGAAGADGVSITSITKTDTVGLVDTYTITYSNGNTSTFTVTNGAAGADGVGIPAGGTDGQVLTKDGSNDYETKWATPSSGGGFVNSENLIINPDMLINQRGVTGTITHGSTARANYTKDRWYLEEGTFTVGSGLNLNNQLNAGGKLTQFIEYVRGRYTGRYIVCGVTVYKYLSAWSYPDVKLSNYLGAAYTPLGSNSINIAINNADGDKYYQFLTVYDVNDINDTSYLRFTLDNTNGSNKAYIVNAFCYITDDKDHFLNAQDAIPVAIPNHSVELEKCKYYFEKITKHSNCYSSFTGSNPLNGILVFNNIKRIQPTVGGNVDVVSISSFSQSTNSTLQLLFDSGWGAYCASQGTGILSFRPSGNHTAYIDAEIYP